MVSEQVDTENIRCRPQTGYKSFSVKWFQRSLTNYRFISLPSIICQCSLACASFSLYISFGFYFMRVIFWIMLGIVLSSGYFFSYSQFTFMCTSLSYFCIYKIIFYRFFWSLQFSFGKHVFYFLLKNGYLLQNHL